MKYTIELTPKARQQLRDLKHNRRTLMRIKTRIDELANNPRPHDVKKLAGAKSLYRIRVGNYRVIYEIRDQALIVLVARLAHRRESYR